MTKIGLSTLVSIGFAVVLYGQPPDDPLTKAIFAAPGWRSVGSPSVHTVADIHRVDPPFAPVLKRYGFESRTQVAWRGPAGDVRSTVYRMADSAAAFGLFSIERHAEASGYTRLPLGADGFRIGSRAVFWRERYVVELEGEAAAVDAWADLALPHISGPSIKPSVIDHLPQVDRAPDSEVYLVSAASMDAAWGVDPARLGFDQNAEAAVARYRIKGKEVRLLLLLYPTQQIAITHEDAFSGVSGGGRLKKRAGSLLAFADASGDDEAAAALLDSVRHEFQVTWNEAPPDKSPAIFVISMFQLVGLAVGVTLAAGAALGVIRIYFRWRYPNQVFDRASEFEMIQLNINKGVNGRDVGASRKA